MRRWLTARIRKLWPSRPAGLRIAIALLTILLGVIVSLS